MQGSLVDRRFFFTEACTLALRLTVHMSEIYIITTYKFSLNP